jgi:hypothetical protein
VNRGQVSSVTRIDDPREICAALIAAGAVSPTGAKALAAFPLIDAQVFDSLVRRGVIREGAPGTFYVYQPDSGSNPTGRLIKTFVFWLLILAIPILLIQFL